MQSHRVLRRGVWWEHSAQGCRLEGLLGERSMPGLQAQQVATRLVKGSYGSMGLLEVPLRTRPHHCDEQTKGRLVVQILYLCRPGVLWEGWHPVFEEDSALLLGWAPGGEAATAPFRARGSSREVLCWAHARGTAIVARM